MKETNHLRYEYRNKNTQTGGRTKLYADVSILYCVQDAVRREVKEEAGVDFEPLSLIGIESQRSYQWLRFTFTGNLLTVATPTVTLLIAY